MFCFVLNFGNVLMGGGGEMMKENKLVFPPSKKEGGLELDVLPFQP